MHDLTHLTRLSESTIRRLIKAGRFPAALEVSPGVRMWPWEAIVLWGWMVRFGLTGSSQEPSTGSHGPSSGDDLPSAP